MSKLAEQENIEKLRDLIKQLEIVREKEIALYGEIDALLRKKYPSSNRDHIRMFRFQLNQTDLTTAKACLKENKILGVGMRGEIMGD